jgi:hypothetical protein
MIFFQAVQFVPGLPSSGACAPEKTMRNDACCHRRPLLPAAGFGLRGGSSEDAGDGREEAESQAQAPSKTAQKRERKLRLHEVRKLARKQRDKEQRRAAREARAAQARVLTAEEEEKTRQQAHAAYVDRVEARSAFAAERARAIAERGGLQRVAIDLAYSTLMRPNEAKSLAAQLAASHGANSKAIVPLDLQIVGLNASSPEGAALSKFEPERWATARAFGAKVTNQSLLACYGSQEVVYLTAEGEETLYNLDPGSKTRNWQPSTPNPKPGPKP